MGLLFYPARRFGPRRAQPRRHASRQRLGRRRSSPGASRRPRRRPALLSRPRRPPGGHDAGARRARSDGRDPPLHPSYEDRPGAPDRIFAALDDARGRAPGRRVGGRAGGRRRRRRRPPAPAPPDAALRGGPARRPGRPDRRPPARHRAADARGDRAATPTAGRTGPPGRERMRDWAAACARIIVLSSQAGRARRARAPDRPGPLRAGPERLRPGELHPAPHRPPALWRRMLVDEPRGWAPDGRTVAYEDVSAFGDARGETPVILYVGRFTEVKRLPLLIEAYMRARPHFNIRAPLVLVGGFPGRVGGRAPAGDDRAPRRAGRLPRRLARARRAPGHPRRDRRHRPARRCASSSGRCWSRGWPAGCRRSPSTRTGPRTSSPTARPAGWSSPTTSHGLANALVEAVNRPDERRRRGANAAADVGERYSWPMLARDVAALYDEVKIEADATILRTSAAQTA